MNILDLLKKNFVLVPVIASILFGTFTGIKYIVNLTDTINANQLEIVKIQEVQINFEDQTSNKERETWDFKSVQA